MIIVISTWNLVLFPPPGKLRVILSSVQEIMDVPFLHVHYIHLLYMKMP